MASKWTLKYGIYDYLRQSDAAGKKKGATRVAPKPPKEDGGEVQIDKYLDRRSIKLSWLIV
jgi:hypothetical protein